MASQNRFAEMPSRPPIPPRDTPAAGAACLPIAAKAPPPDKRLEVTSQLQTASSGIRPWRCPAAAVRTLDEVREAMERDPEAARAAAARLVALLTPQAPDEPPCVRGGLAPWQQRAVDRYMRQRLDAPLRVKDLAEQVALSVSHFCRAFKESFGTTPHLHLTRLRVRWAQRLMLTTADPLSQIALACGMADQAHLSKLFRRTVGESPSAWRRRNGSGEDARARGGLRETHPPVMGEHA